MISYPSVAGVEEGGRVTEDTMGLLTQEVGS